MGVVKIKTLNNETMLVNTGDIDFHKTEEKNTYYPHWGWLVLWILVFWPFAVVWFVIGITRKQYRIAVRGYKNWILVSESTYNQLSRQRVWCKTQAESSWFSVD